MRWKANKKYGGNDNEQLSKYGKRVLLTYGGGSIKRSGLYDAVTEEIKNAGLELYELSGIAPNPRIDSVRDGARMCKEHNIDSCSHRIGDGFRRRYQQS